MALPMWQPIPRQWLVIWPVALLLVLAWPPDQGRSLGVKFLNWMADPTQSLPELPEALPMALDDNGDAVAEHDALVAEYYRVYDNSALARWRLDLKGATDPIDPTTERQLLMAIGVLGGLAVWRLQGKRAER